MLQKDRDTMRMRYRRWQGPPSRWQTLTARVRNVRKQLYLQWLSWHCQTFPHRYPRQAHVDHWD